MDGIQQQQQHREPTARYSKLSEKLRQVTPDDLQCSMFCGGRKCKYDSGAAWEDKDMAIAGIYSHWITSNILAAARPNTFSIEKYDIINQFERANIKSLINLQSRNEHLNCGGPLHESGFSYNPQVFMNNGIFFYNFSIKDYGVASHEFILDMVKVIAFALTEGKVAVHCHAGLGRTGVLIACYLVYALRVRANEAIRYVRIRRPKSIQTRGQIVCVQDFAKFILPNFVVFPSGNNCVQDGITLEQCLSNQGRILHGYEARDLKYFPKLMVVICQRLLHLSGCQETNVDNKPSKEESAPFWKTYFSAATPGSTSNSAATSSTSVDDFGNRKPAPQEIVSSRLRRKHSSSALAWSLSASPPVTSSETSCVTPPVPTSSRAPPLVRKESTETISSQYRSWDEDSTLAGAASSSSSCDLLDDTLSLCSLSTESTVATPHNDLTLNACYRELLETQAVSGDGVGSGSAVISAEDVVAIFIRVTKDEADLPRDIQDRINKYKQDLNEHCVTWERLARESNSQVLVALLCHWFHSLKEAIVGVKDSGILKDLNETELPNKLTVGVRFTIEYLVRFACQLQPLSDGTRQSLLRKISELLTQKVETGSLNDPNIFTTMAYLDTIVQELYQGENNIISSISR